MSEFRTIVDVDKSDVKIDYTQKLFLIGSCFTENIGAKLGGLKFQTNINPFGILYNPESIGQCFNMIIDEHKFSDSDLVENEGIWNSLYHHSKFSTPDKDEMLLQLNSGIKLQKKVLIKSDFVLITFGTAWVYKYLQTGNVVSNCHKIQAKEFERSRLQVDEIIQMYTGVIERIRALNPNVRFLFTVSPVRHMKDGAVENQLSKSTLILAIHKIIEKLNSAFYFPSYEIVMDDLRDYRFYNTDMVHPSDTAVEYIWQRFSESWLSDKARDFMKQIEKVQRATQHRPFQPEAEGHQRFIKKQLQIIDSLQKQMTDVNFESEIEYFQKALK